MSVILPQKRKTDVNNKYIGTMHQYQSNDDNYVATLSMHTNFYSLSCRCIECLFVCSSNDRWTNEFGSWGAHLELNEDVCFWCLRWCNVSDSCPLSHMDGEVTLPSQAFSQFAIELIRLIPANSHMHTHTHTLLQLSQHLGTLKPMKTIRVWPRMCSLRIPYYEL